MRLLALDDMDLDAAAFPDQTVDQLIGAGFSNIYDQLSTAESLIMSIGIVDLTLQFLILQMS